MEKAFYKQADLSIPASVSAEEMDKINQFALKDLSADEVFVFNIMAADTGQDDRNYEPFTGKAIQDMAEKFIGKPMLTDHGHGPKGSEQIARIFDSAVKVSEDGQIQLTLKAYMMRTDTNADLIKEIEAGIKKEVSTSVYPDHINCSICGKDQTVEYCRHFAGKMYRGKRCLMMLDGVKDALEVSFVGVPAQPRAGMVKSYNPDAEDMIYKPEKERDTDLEYFEALMKVMGG